MKMVLCVMTEKQDLLLMPAETVQEQSYGMRPAV
jgi:hypothetical protein